MESEHTLSSELVDEQVESGAGEVTTGACSNGVADSSVGIINPLKE